MPTVLDAEILQLYMLLLKQKVKDQYRGHEDLHIMLKSIDSDVPIVGGEVTVQKEDRNGNFYTRTYHVTVKDDLGNFINGVDDLGGQCMKGEITKKGFIYQCLECGDLFCRRHVAFVDKDYNKPLCRYGFMKLEGCYFTHWKEHTDGGTSRIREATEHIEALTEYETARRKLEAVKKGQVLLDSESGSRLLLPRKKTGLLGRMLHGSVHSVKCGNCDWLISFADYKCSNCHNVVDIDIDSPLACPRCGEPVRQVRCPRCEATNEL